MKKVVGAILLCLGVLFLLGNLGYLPRLGMVLAKWWPVVPIVLGAALLFRR